MTSDSYRPLGHNEKSNMLWGLYDSHNIPIDRERLEDWIACIDFEQMCGYMEDIGLILHYDILSVTTSITTINDDKIWIRRKLELLRDHFVGGTYDQNDSNTINNSKRNHIRRDVDRVPLKTEAY